MESSPLACSVREPSLCQEGLHATLAIKEKTEDEERVGISNSQKREGWKTVGEEEKAREKVSEGLSFLSFFFLRHCRERAITGEWGFLSCKIGREYCERKA